MVGMEWSEESKPEVQRLVLSTYDSDCSLHLLLAIKDIGAARAFLTGLMRDDRVTFGDREPGDIDEHGAVNIGFTYQGLVALELPESWLGALRDRAVAFSDGAPIRAARRLGDTAASAAEDWEPMFRADRVDMLITIYGRDETTVRRLADDLEARVRAREALDGWETARIEAAHLPGTTKEVRTVHFGFRDPVAMPKIVEAQVQRSQSQHNAGELVLGYSNDEDFNRWGDDGLADDLVQFLRNGSFGVLRKIEQHEERFNQYLDEQVERLRGEHPHVTRDYLKAKICGRWPNGALVLPTDVVAPTGSTLQERLSPDFGYQADPKGFGCPFGAHIRRINPRDDPIAPPRLRPLFRRGMPYGSSYIEGECPARERGLIGLFFCASIEDQFEHLVSEWIENKPMGPANSGR